MPRRSARSASTSRRRAGCRSWRTPLAEDRALLGPLRAALGVARSWALYRGRDGARRGGMDAMHRRFVGQGELAFDVGAHVGDRTASFRRLGARVVAVEPQPNLARLLRLAHGRDAGVTIVAAAVGRTPGRLTLRLNPDNPTVATASDAFVAAARDAPGWQGQDWRGAVEVEATTLDALIAAHGTPQFIKIDVEGFEAEALEGLSTAPRALSFEFTTIQRDVAADALARLSVLGYRAFNAALGESQSFVHPAPVDAGTIAGWLQALPADANSGDVYASLEPERLASG